MLTPETTVRRKLGGSRRERMELAQEVLEHVDRAVHYALRALATAPAPREDLVSDLMLYLYRDDAKVLRNWDPERATFKGYLSMVGRRFVFRRRTGRPAPSALPDDDPPYLSDEHSMEDEMAYRAALEEIYDWVHEYGSDKDRARFAHIMVEERTPAEVAQLEGVSVDAIYTWMSRFKARIQQGLPHLIELIALREHDPTRPTHNQ